ncbi:hypothetical protein BpHYR1_018777 [Brachionus plicatilis]|uniref:Uncharacterized protein n=1 Tax=Brachionus plicatilis TaxID=10195 RepID=A0A3M7QYQ6_BRAPC|nr:hypothetical protein BpHYR1_018777 [Brachionus plicatilis]
MCVVKQLSEQHTQDYHVEASYKITKKRFPLAVIGRSDQLQFPTTQTISRWEVVAVFTLRIHGSKAVLATNISICHIPALLLQIIHLKSLMAE